MANKNLNARIVLRNDTKANWQSVNPILMKGELGVEFDPSTTATGRKILFKIGDGVTNWNDLPYGGGDFAEVIAQLQQALPISDFSSSHTVAAAISAVDTKAGAAATAASAAQSAATAAQNTADSAVTAASHAQDAADAAQATANAASTLANANKTTLDTLTASATVVGSIDYKIAQASSALSSRIDGIQGQIGSGFDSIHTVANAITTVSNAAAAAQSTADSAVTSANAANQAIAVLNGAASVTGSVANTIDTTLNATGGVNARISNLEAILPKDSFSYSNTVASVLNSLDGRIDALEGNHFEVVSVLPATGQTNVIYLVPDEHVGYKEWIYIKTGSNPDTYAWEEIGDTNIDLSNYYTKSEVDSQDLAALAAAQTYANNVGTTTLASANAALSSAIEGEVTRANTAYLANTDVLILDCGNASTNYSAS